MDEVSGSWESRGVTIVVLLSSQISHPLETVIINSDSIALKLYCLITAVLKLMFKIDLTSEVPCDSKGQLIQIYLLSSQT